MELGQQMEKQKEFSEGVPLGEEFSEGILGSDIDLHYQNLIYSFHYQL